MSGGLAAATSHRRYGALDSVPDVAFADSNTKMELIKSCDQVANDIRLINNGIRELTREVDKIGTAKDNQNVRQSVQAIQLRCNDLMKKTMAALEDIPVKSRSADKETKLQVERLQAELQIVVPAYGTIQKHAVEKTRQYVLQQPVSPTEDLEQFQLREQEAAYNQQQRQLQMELEFEGGMLSDRMVSIKNVEVEVLDINSMMNTVAKLVHEQAPLLDTIEQNTENTLVNVENANQELHKASSYVGRRRRTVVCIAIIAIVVVVILITILLIK